MTSSSAGYPTARNPLRAYCAGCDHCMGCATDPATCYICGDCGDPLPDPRELVQRLFPRKRSRLVVEIDIDPVPGWGSTSGDHRDMLRQLLDSSIPHYNPSVEDVTDDA